MEFGEDMSGWLTRERPTDTHPSHARPVHPTRLSTPWPVRQHSLAEPGPPAPEYLAGVGLAADAPGEDHTRAFAGSFPRRPPMTVKLGRPGLHIYG